MAVLILNTDDSELFLPDAFAQLWNAAQAVASATPTACIENAKPKAGTLHFQYFEDNSGRLKSIYYKSEGEPT